MKNADVKIKSPDLCRRCFYNKAHCVISDCRECPLLQDGRCYCDTTHLETPCEQFIERTNDDD